MADPGFLGLPARQTDPLRSRFVVLPGGYEETTTYKQGTAKGPAAILAASHQVELYDEELADETCKAGVHTAPAFPFPKGHPEGAMRAMERATAPWLKRGKRVVMLGGEHSITLGCVRAAKKRWKDLSVMHVDAHADLRQSYHGSIHNHACIGARMVELCPVVQVGIRNLTRPEHRQIKAGKNIRTYFDIERPRVSWTEVVSHLSPHVYFTIDLDGLDPAIMPSVGTPEPGGLDWQDLLGLMRALFASREVVMMDVMELCPLPGFHAPDFLTAKLIYKAMGYWNRADARRSVPSGTPAPAPPRRSAGPRRGRARP